MTCSPISPTETITHLSRSEAEKQMTFQPMVDDISCVRDKPLTASIFFSLRSRRLNLAYTRDRRYGSFFSLIEHMRR